MKIFIVKIFKRNFAFLNNIKNGRYVNFKGLYIALDQVQNWNEHGSVNNFLMQ